LVQRKSHSRSSRFASAAENSAVALDQNSTIIAVIELSQSSWLVAGVVPGIERQPRKKLEPSPERLLAVLHRWRDEAVRAGRTITRPTRRHPEDATVGAAAARWPVRLAARAQPGPLGAAGPLEEGDPDTIGRQMLGGLAQHIRRSAARRM
jgi:hypothetical protein